MDNLPLIVSEALVEIKSRHQTSSRGGFKHSPNSGKISIESSWQSWFSKIFFRVASYVRSFLLDGLLEKSAQIWSLEIIKLFQSHLRIFQWWQDVISSWPMVTTRYASRNCILERTLPIRLLNRRVSSSFHLTEILIKYFIQVRCSESVLNGDLCLVRGAYWHDAI